jgi:3-oxoacyl-[acyl-carrier protein] reductase
VNARRSALVTGASRGIGAAIARALARDGMRVGINYLRDEASATSVRDEIVRAGGEAELVRADVTDELEVEALAEAVANRLGDIDTLVLNATGPQPDIPVEALHWRDVHDQLAFFVKSPLLLTQLVLPGMKRAGRGRIINIGSEVVELGVPGSSAYVAAKAAQLGITRSWARELGPYGITVNVVAPGWIPTDRHADIPADAYAAQVPLRRTGLAEEVAETVAFLASDRGSFITGQKIAVNGGNTLA